MDALRVARSKTHRPEPERREEAREDEEAIKAREGEPSAGAREVQPDREAIASMVRPDRVVSTHVARMEVPESTAVVSRRR